MLHLQKHLGISFRHQYLFSAARFATTASPDPAPFAVEDYLVATCGLTPAQALKASKALFRLKSPSKPDAVVAFLSGLGLSSPDIAAVVTRVPTLLCCKVDKTLAPRVAELRDFDLSPSQIARLVLRYPNFFRQHAISSKLQYFVPLFGSFDDLLRALRRSHYFFSVDLETVVKPNVSCLRECGLGVLDISKLCLNAPRLLYARPESVQAMVSHAEDLGIPRGTPMFKYALQLLASRSKEFIAAKAELVKKTFRWSDAQLDIAVSRLPWVLIGSEDRTRRVSEFLISEVGLDPEYIARRPALIRYSLEGRLIPRHYVLKFLKANGFLEHNRCYYTAAAMSEKAFVENFIHPYKEAAPLLAEDYAAACRGEVPYRLQEPGTGLASV